MNLGDICKGLGSLMSELHVWSKKKFGSIVKRLETSWAWLEELLANHADREEIRKVEDEMNELLYREELMWMQRSRIAWLQDGDRNTKFFQNKAVWRAGKNKVKKLVDETGVSHEEPTVMANMTNDYFKQIFTRDESLHHAPVVDLLEQRVTDKMNDKLCAPFSDKEISDSLFQIGPLKAPGKDGFPARFFQQNWLVLREEVIKAVREFFSNGVMPEV